MVFLFSSHFRILTQRNNINNLFTLASQWFCT